MKYNLLIILGFILSSMNSYAQNTDSTEVEWSEGENYAEQDTNLIKETFQSTRIINGHSNENLQKGVLEFRIEHRFGDIAGTEGGAQTAFGFDNAADIRFGFEYGVTKDFMVGIGRSKGTGAPYKSLLDGFGKYKIIKQKRNGSPISLTGIATMNYTYMKASEDISQVSNFPESRYRFAYSTQLNLARKFGERLSLAVMPTLVHRNYVASDDINTIFAVGGAIRCNITPTVAILVEYYQCLHGDDIRSTNTNSLGVALEIITFGHNFTINLTNSKGIGDVQFITGTYEDWLKGQFRLGFCIGRKFEKG